MSTRDPPILLETLLHEICEGKTSTAVKVLMYGNYLKSIMPGLSQDSGRWYKQQTLSLNSAPEAELLQQQTRWTFKDSEMAVGRWIRFLLRPQGEFKSVVHQCLKLLLAAKYRPNDKGASAKFAKWMHERVEKFPQLRAQGVRTTSFKDAASKSSKHSKWCQTVVESLNRATGFDPKHECKFSLPAICKAWELDVVPILESKLHAAESNGDFSGLEAMMYSLTAKDCFLDIIVKRVAVLCYCLLSDCADNIEPWERIRNVLCDFTFQQGVGFCRANYTTGELLPLGALARAGYNDGGMSIFQNEAPISWNSYGITAFRGLVQKNYEGNTQLERKFMLSGFPTRRDDYLRQIMGLGPHAQYHMVGALDVIGKGTWPAGPVLNSNLDAIQDDLIAHAQRLGQKVEVPRLQAPPKSPTKRRGQPTAAPDAKKTDKKDTTILFLVGGTALLLLLLSRK